MEITIYQLQKEHDEFKDLSYDQLMKIGELCLKYYQKGFNSAGEDVQQDLQDEIDDLERQLDDSDYEYHKLENQYEDLEDLLKEVYLCDSIKEAKETIELFSESNGYDYKWDWLNKNKN